MIYFSTLNSIKLTEFDSESMPNFRNRNYSELNRGVNQEFANTDIVGGAMFNNFEDIVIQVRLDTDTDTNDVDISLSNTVGDVVNLGTLATPLSGASVTEIFSNTEMFIYNLTVPSNLIAGYCSFSFYDGAEDLDFYSEIFYINESSFVDKDLGRDVLVLKYKYKDGYYKDYYWTTYQYLKIDCAYYSAFNFEVESEKAEGRTKTVVLESDSRKVDTYTLTSMPQYLYEKIIKASAATDLHVNGEAMVLNATPDISSSDDGLCTFEIQYKEKQTTNTY